MNQSDENHLDLREKLDEAGRLWRPSHPGWDTLLDRLPAQESAAEKRPSQGGPPPRRYRWRTWVVAAAVLVAVGLGFFLCRAPHDVVAGPIEVIRRGIQVTIFSAGDNREPTLYMPTAENAHQQSPGMALVKDQRMILNLRKGDNEVKFTDVAVTIDPTSVRLVSDTDPLGTKVIEQNFEFDLASADALLKRSLEKKITCVGKDDGELYEGYLLSYDGGSIVLADKRPSDDPNVPQPKTQTISRNKLQAVRLDHKPDDLYTRPTLVWILRTQKPGTHYTTLTYLCGNAVWQADYVALIRQSGAQGDTLDLKAWVTVDNRSGATYEDAGLKLIAGDVNRVRDPWAPQPRQSRARSAAGVRVNFTFFATALGVKEFQEKSFFEYKLYTLSQPSTIKDRQIKQLSLFEAEGVKARRRYVCRSQEGSRRRPEVELLIQNEKKNHLGRPLPKGKLALTAIDPDGDHQLLGRHQIGHTAKDEELKLNLSRAFDVVYGYRIVETRRPAEDRMIRTYEFRVRNHKPHAVDVRAVAVLGAQREVQELRPTREGEMRPVTIRQASTDWSIQETSDEFSKHDHRTVHFDVSVGSDSEETITYTVEYRWQ